MPDEDHPERPSVLWRGASTLTTTVVGAFARTFLFTFCKLEIHGLEAFIDLLESRWDVNGRQRGLITVSNHLSVLDDPLIWGPLPFKFFRSPDNLRWSMGSYDICFNQTKIESAFFTFGQLLPTHRSRHSPFGGLFQPTVTQAIRLLSEGPFPKPYNYHATPESPVPRKSFSKPDLADPFSSGNLTYTTNGYDVFPAPSAYLNRRHAWVHIFPEGKVHQMPDLNMRYFKWGIARLILESEPCPDVVPLWFEGMEQVMDEERGSPRFLPRIGKRVSITYGDALDVDKVFGDLRERWKRLYNKEIKRLGESRKLDMGVLNDELKYGKEAVDLRTECTMRVRKEVLKLRIARGRSDEDPKWSLVETYALEGKKEEGKMDDGSIVKDM
ncbi:hypothetical protein NA57DRAFT_65256 [Rhizodiscina lignyota]|uniref:Tafazzin family protein n=1 Tax=Rhizodiscina lignyota TaxID=1504668 RepID=A0A9P4M7W3_9PEZI|nr:hypothetical protein NA57DRAFT_65256 [Rhizodiscina lignyota]